MKLPHLVSVVTPLLFVAGCLTIYQAQDAQRSLAGKGVGEASAFEKLDLSGYSLHELVDFALTNRPSMLSAALAVVDAHLALKEVVADAPLVSYSPWLAPHLSLSGGYSASSAADQALRWRTDGNASAGLSLSILVYDFGRNRARAEAQIERVIASEYAFVQSGYEVFNDVALSYFNLMECDALFEVALTNENECALRLKQAEDRFAAGEAKRLDVTTAKLDLSQAHETRISASNDVVIAGARLMTALGLDVTRGNRDEVFPATGHALSQVVRGFRGTHYRTDTAFELARTNAPTLAIARARLRSASSDVDLAIADLMPSVSAEVSVNWADPLWAWHWGVSAFQSLFEGFRKTTAVDRAVVALQNAAAQVDEAEQTLSRDLEEAIAVRDNAKKQLETARVSVVNALENLNTAKAQYHEGDVSRVDLTIAISKYASTLGSRVSAFYAWQKAEMYLFSLMGKIPEYDEEVLKEN